MIIVNADKIKVTGKKLEQKIYYHHSDYVGGMKETTLKEMLAKKPEYVITPCCKGNASKGNIRTSDAYEASCICWSRARADSTEAGSIRNHRESITKRGGKYIVANTKVLWNRKKKKQYC